MVLSEFEIDAYTYAYFCDLFMATPSHSRIERATQDRYHELYSEGTVRWFGPDYESGTFAHLAEKFRNDTQLQAAAFMGRYPNEQDAIAMIDRTLLKVRITNGR